jgi:hypothetical protein
VKLGRVPLPTTGLSVAESRWFESGNDSVRPLFETLAGIVEGNPHGFRYDMFSEAASLENIITDVCDNGAYHSFYIAAHGSEDCIYGLNDNRISRTVLRNILRSHNTNCTVSGLYFGSCSVATRNNAAFLLDSEQPTNLTWVAGYSEPVNWIDSSAIDMIFWSKYLHERKRNRSRKRGKRSELEMIQHAASEMKMLMPTIFTALGFNIYYLDTGGTLTWVW